MSGKSRLLENIRESVADLHKIGLVDDVTLREFDAMDLPPVPEYGREDIKRIREKCKVSQAVFAAFLHVSRSTVSQWEQGEKKPRGASLKLLELVDRKGLEVLV